jgi:hypothetical protein
MSSPNDQQRTILPIPDPARTGLITYDVRDPKYPPIAGTLKLNGYSTAQLGKCIP